LIVDAGNAARKVSPKRPARHIDLADRPVAVGRDGRNGVREDRKRSLFDPNADG
jgi:hypothetical protein